MTQDLLKRLTETEARLAALSVAAEETLTAVERGKGLDQAVHQLRKAWQGSKNARWGRQGCIEAGLLWFETYGAPPKVEDWHPKLAMNRTGSEAAAERYYAGRWPHYSLVRYHFANWQRFMVACEFEPREGPETFNTGATTLDRYPAWAGWQFLRPYRSRAGLTLARLSELSNVSMPHISDIENGQHTNPGIRLMLALSQALGIRPGAFYE